MSGDDWRWGTSADLHHRMSDMISGYFVSQLVRAVVELGVADHLAQRPLRADDLAQKVGADVDGTYRLLRAAITIDLVTLDDDGLFHETPLLATLRSGTPGTLRGTALARTTRAFWDPWGSFAAAVRTGESQAERVLGTDFFGYLKQNPDQAKDFRAHMDASTTLWSQHAIDVSDTTGVTLAVDVGGANGSMLRALQAVNGRLHGVIFDRPEVADAVRADLRGTELAERITVVGGDFFESVPSADLVLLKYILHDWGDDECVTILSNCRAALSPNGRIDIVEMVIGEARNPGFAALMDLNMLALAKGARERTLAEYDGLLHRAGLRRTRFHPTPSPQSVISAVPV